MKKYSEIFAENLHRLRKEMKLTQEQLADKICYTEKAVSKWESGSSVPPAETLILLAEIFNVSIDELFDHCTHPAYYLGIDGGATKTVFALADADGNIINKLTLGPSNPFDIGYDRATELLTEGINKITANIHKRKISVEIIFFQIRLRSFEGAFRYYIYSCFPSFIINCGYPALV